MDRRVVRRHRLLRLRVLLAVDDAQLADPRRVFLGIELALRFLHELLEDRARVADDRYLDVAVPADLRGVPIVRSEEHTSELQSRGHLVCRLLLEKKNQRTTS